MCTGCMACVDSCAHGALKSFVAGDGHIYPLFDRNKCTDCGLCDKVCPVASPIVLEDKGPYPIGAWSKDDKVRSNSASGGVFASLAYSFINEGGYVAGAVMEGLSVKHIVTNEAEMILKMQGSKYQQGDASGVYKTVRKLLVSGHKVLFCGSPCQTAALYRYVNGNRYEGRLVIVDFICGGFPSVLPLRALMDNSGFKVKGIVSFRDKDNGWKSKGYTYNLKVEDDVGVVHSMGYENIVTKAFVSHLLCRNSCRDCRFASIHRVSDLTIGDFWGCGYWPEEEPKGISVAVIHNEAIESELSQAGLITNPVTWKDFLPYNPRMVYGQFTELDRSPVARHPALFFKLFPYKVLCSLFNVSGYRSLFSRAHNFYMKKAYMKHKENKDRCIADSLKEIDSWK